MCVPQAAAPEVDAVPEARRPEAVKPTGHAGGETQPTPKRKIRMVLYFK